MIDEQHQQKVDECDLLKDQVEGYDVAWKQVQKDDDVKNESESDQRQEKCPNKKHKGCWCESHIQKRIDRCREEGCCCCWEGWSKRNSLNRAWESGNEALDWACWTRREQAA